MTSRARRIVLAMYGHKPSSRQIPTQFVWTRGEPQQRFRLHDFGCYEAMDDVDPITADLPLSPIVGGNFGLPCA